MGPALLQGWALSAGAPHPSLWQRSSWPHSSVQCLHMTGTVCHYVWVDENFRIWPRWCFQSWAPVFREHLGRDYQGYCPPRVQQQSGLKPLLIHLPGAFLGFQRVPSSTFPDAFRRRFTFLGVWLARLSGTATLANCQGRSWVEHHLNAPWSGQNLFYGQRGLYSLLTAPVTLQSMCLEVGVQRP